MSVDFYPLLSPGYMKNLFDSFIPGGTTPIEGFLGLSGVFDSGDSDVISSSSEPSSTYVSESSSPTFDYSNEASDIYQAIIDATNLQNQVSQASADRAMEFSEEQARLAREFNAEQSQLAFDRSIEAFGKRYQMTMEDLRNAGLNPKLVGSLGSPSAPGGIAASASAPVGVAASMSMQNISALAGVLETYMTNVNALDRQEKQFVQDRILAVIDGLFSIGSSAIRRK